jgi:phosphoribosyl 1,2-cyclic phosphodiesterase
MRIRFWGTRGSIPTPGPSTVRYGGNTSCIEVSGEGAERVILDAGSGIRPFGLELVRQMPVSCSIFITHTHWDHIQGLPFFVPLFVPGNTISLYGPPDLVTMQSLEQILAIQMEHRYFPVRQTELKSPPLCRTLRENETIAVGNIEVTSICMNHTVLSYGYKVRCGGKTVFYTGDHEPYANIYSPGEAGYEEYECSVQERREELIDFLRGVDMLIADAQYTEEEYTLKRGWGHSTFHDMVDMARRADITSLYLLHHDPERSDDELDRILASLRTEYAGRSPDIHMAIEGSVVEL